MEAVWDHDLSVEGMEGGQAGVVKTLVDQLWVFQLGALIERWLQPFPDLSASLLGQSLLRDVLE